MPKITAKGGAKAEIYLDKAKEISLAKLASLTRDEKLNAISFLSMQIEKPEYEIPVSIFDNDSLSSLEAIVKYSVEVLLLRFTEISRLLDRSDKTIWTTYQNASQKMHGKFSLKNTKLFIPLNVIKNRKLSVLENIVVFLKERHLLKFSEIAGIMNRNYRTILTVYNRSLKKGNKHETN